MSDAEYFLLAWAVIATVVAGLFASKARYTGQAVQAMMFAIVEIAEGKAEVSMKDGVVQIKKIKD